MADPRLNKLINDHKELERARHREALDHIAVDVLLDELDRYSRAHAITGPKSTAEIMGRAYRWIKAAHGLRKLEDE